MKAKFAALAIAIAAVVLNIAATPADAGVAIIGSGVNNSCGTWNENHRWPNGAAAMLEDQWVLGFISGAAAAGRPEDNFNPLNGLDYHAVVGWMNNFCAANPLTDIYSAAVEFMHTHPR